MVSRREYCKRKGLNYDTVRHRMKTHNQTFEQVVSYYETNGVKPKQILVDCDGELVSARECCRRKNLSYRVVQNRVYKLKETYKQAIEYLETHREAIRKRNRTVKNIRFYNIWFGVVNRCTNPKNSDFEKYSWALL